MSNPTTSSHVFATYITLRRGLGWIAIAFPLLLAIGGYFSAGLHLEGSMSAYYHASPITQEYEQKSETAQLQKAESKQQIDLGAPHQGVMRNWFVGLLFTLGILLCLYKGFSRMEDIALNIAGSMALGVALFPMEWGLQFKGMGFSALGVPLSAHGACAITLFLCIAYVSIFRASDTLDLVKDPILRKRYRGIYKWLGWAMIGSPLTAFILNSFLSDRSAYTFFVELAGIWSFAAFWLVKSYEISKSDADRKAAHGKLHVHDVNGTGPFREIRISETEVQNAVRDDAVMARLE